MGTPVRLLISVGSIFILLFGYRCSSETNVISPSPTPTPAATVPPMEMRLREEDMRRDLQDQVTWAKLTDLAQVSLPLGQFEIRIWVGFDGMETPGFVFRSGETGKNAALISARFIRRGGKVTVTPVRTELAAPRSGWSSFEGYLKDQGLTNPLKFSPDNIHIVDPDEGSIVIETKSDSAYSMVFFPLGTETEDGKRALQICRKVEQEFGISMRCSEGRS
jgi:hypothetical protein